MEKFGHFVGKYRKASIPIRFSPKPIKVAVLDDGCTVLNAINKFKHNKIVSAAFEPPYTGHTPTRPMLPI